jgi:phage-related protein
MGIDQQLLRVQMGLMPNNYKAMSVCVLHVFTKKSQRTAKVDIDLAKKRYREARDG